MKFIAISALGFLGGLVFSFLGWHSNSALTSSPEDPQTVTANKPVLPSPSIPRDESATDQEKLENNETGAADPIKRNLLRKIELLEKGRVFLHEVPDYTTTLTKREVVKGELLDPQKIVIKCRPQPFSVYLKWLEGDVGREVIYVDGSNEGKMIAHDGGWKARIPAFTLSVDCMLAMRDSRYPVTMAGLKGLTDMMLDIHRKDLAENTVASCDVDEAETIDGRPCYRFSTNYQSVSVSPTYRKSTTWIDKEWNVPLKSQHYEWPQSGVASGGQNLDDSTLIESYSFEKIEFRRGLTDRDFDRDNEEYGFR